MSAQGVVQSVTHLSPVTSVGLLFLACGALCGVAAAEGHRLPALRARRPPVHTPHALLPSRCARAEEVPCPLHYPPLFREFATAECVNLSSRVTRGESIIRFTPPGISIIRLHLWEIHHPVTPCACHKPVARTPSALPADVLSPKNTNQTRENPVDGVHHHPPRTLH